MALTWSVAATLGAAAEDEGGPRPPFTLAILRRDSVLVPFATWTGKDWTNTWPVPRKAAETPITLDAVPKRWWGKTGPIAAWHAWTRDGAQHELRPASPTWFLAHCEQGTGIRSSYKSPVPAPPPILQPYPKDGIAASTAMKFQPIAVMGSTSPIWKAVGDALPEPLAAEEDRLVKGLSVEGWQHPQREAGRRQVPVTVEALYRTSAGTGGQFLYYFEAVKRYPSDEPPKTPRETPVKQDALDKRAADAARETDCGVVTFVSGWFHAGNGDSAVKLGAITAVLTSCDYAAADVMFPLAYTDWNGSPLWIVQFSGWGREWYALLHAGAEPEPRVLLRTLGGVCPLA